MHSGAVNLDIPYIIEKPTGGTLRAEAHDLSIDVAGLEFRPRDAEDDWLRLGRVELRGGRIRWPEKTVDADLVRISEPWVKAWRAEDKTINWMAFLERLSAPGERAGESTSSGWKTACAAFEIAGGSIQVEDRAVAPVVKLALSGLESRLENLTSDGSAPVKARLAANVNGSGTVSAAGTVELRPLAADLDVEAAGLELPFLQPYASRLARAQLQSGAAGIRGKAIYREGAQPLIAFDGRATLDRLSLADPKGERVLAWDGLAVEGIRLTLQPDLLRVRVVEVRNPFAQVLIDREGKIGALELLESESPVSEPAPAQAAPPSAAASPFPFEIGSIRLRGGKVDYGDRSLILPFAARIHGAEGSVTDLSSRGAAGSRLLVEGKVDEYGYVKVEGTLRVFDPYAASDVRVLFRNVEMSRLTPYVAEFAGYSIEEGRLDLDVAYEIRDRALVGSHKLAASQLTLGDKVDGAKASLPLKLAVALLKDSQGRIELDVPIEGSIDDPEFAYRKVIWSAFKRILVNVTTAPFRFLGRLMGIDGDDLEFVSFEAGRSALLPPEQEKLGKLVEGLKSRPEIVLQVGGRFDPVSDATALREEKLEALIATRRGTAGEDGAILDRILESLYAEGLPPGALETLRQKHTTVPPAPPEAGKKAPPPQPVLDAAGYYEEMRAALLAAQSVGPDDLAALARERAEAIVAALTAEGALDVSRVTSSEVEEVKKKKAGQEMVPCQLEMPSD
jgi:hypothetical protein